MGFEDVFFHFWQKFFAKILHNPKKTTTFAALLKRKHLLQ